MGLDIYLSRYNDFEKTQEIEKDQRKFDDKTWEDAGEYDNLSSEQKDEISKKISDHAISLGLDKWGEDKESKETIELNHPDYPEHYFKIGYFRSSYNEGGIQRILRNLGLPTLDDVFDHVSDEYCFKPDWSLALTKCETLIESFKGKGNYRVQAVTGNMFRDSTITSESQALETFMKEIENHTNSDYNYGNANGDFSFHEPLKVLAMIPGKTNLFGNRDCVYVVTESSNEWYIQALEIVRDTCKYVLSQENIGQYYLRWSG